MLKSHKQCQALLSFALLSSRRVCPSHFPGSLSIYCLPFVLSNEARKSAWKCVQYEKAMTELDRQEEGEKEREKWWTRQTARMCGGEQRTKEPCRRHSNCYLQPGYSPSPFLLATWNKTIIKSTRGWRCGRQRKSKSWLEPAPLTIGLSSARVGVYRPCQGCTV